MGFDPEFRRGGTRARAWAECAACRLGVTSRGALPFVVLALAIVASPLRAAPGDSDPGPDRPIAGVRFVASLFVPPTEAAGVYTDLTVELAISAHAGSVDFYGAVPVALGAFAARDGAPERLAWSETGCHRDRGLPKISFRRIVGTARLGERVTSIDAVMRTIGMRLPSDEIVVEQSLLAGEPTDTRREYLLRAHTRASGVAVAVRLRRVACAL